MRKFVSFLLVLAVMISLIGCKETEQDPVARTDINLAIPGDVNTLSPSNSNSAYEGGLFGNIFEGLVRVNSDYEVVPAVASSWTVSEDGLEYTFTIRDGIKFHDGTEVTAHDVKFSYDLYVSKPSFGGTTFMISSTEVIDEDTFVVNLAFPYVSFLQYSSYLSVLSESHFTDLGEDDFGRDPIGSGPYMLKEWVVGEKIVLEAFEDYYDGKAQIETINYSIIIDSTARVIALENGEIDFASIQALDYDNLQGSSDLVTLTGTTSNYYFNSINTLRVPKDVRIAINHAIDREGINTVVTEGTGTVSATPLLPFAEGYSTSFTEYDYDVTEAKSIMEGLGYNSGNRLELKFVYIESDSNRKWAEAAQAYLSEIYIDLEIVSYEMSAWFSSITTGDFDITVTALEFTPGYIDWALNLMFGSYGQFNIQYHYSANIDNLILASYSETDQEIRGQYLASVVEEVTEEALIIPGQFITAFIAFDNSLKGIDSVNSVRIYDLYWDTE